MAFGAVVVVVAVVAGLVWFLAGARSGGVPAASAAPRSAAEDGAGVDSRWPPTCRADHDDRRRWPCTWPGPSPGPASITFLPAPGSPTPWRWPAGSCLRADVDRLNLAARLVDGQKIFVTRRGEPVPPGIE